MLAGCDVLVAPYHGLELDVGYHDLVVGYHALVGVYHALVGEYHDLVGECHDHVVVVVVNALVNQLVYRDVGCRVMVGVVV